jgi:transglutaminase-like putative cysteine protease
MSTGLALAPGPTPAARPLAGADGADGRVATRSESTGLRLACFFALAAFCGYQYSTLLLHPPALRVLLVAAAATALGAALGGVARLRLAPPLRAAAALALALAALATALLAVGVPLSLLAPGRWHTLVHDLDHGFDGLAGWLWPYRGEATWPRVTVLALLAPVEVVAAVACFWPFSASRGAAGAAGVAGRARGRGLALALMVALLVTGLANQTAPAWRVQGIALLLVLAAWLWLPTLTSTAFPRAARWLCAAAVAALALAPALDAREPLLDFRDWNPLPVTAAFEWNQLYGPITWSRSDATMFEVAEPHPALLRVTTLDRFDGLRFLRSAAPPANPQQDLPLLHMGSGGFVGATVAIAGLRSPLLVGGGGEPLRVRWLTKRAPASVAASDGTTTLTPGLTTGQRYEVLSYVPNPGVAALRAAPLRYPAAYLPYARFALPGPSASALRAPDLQAEASAAQPAATLVGAPAPGRTPASDAGMSRRLAASPYGPAFALARRLARGAQTPYDVASRIEHYLLTSYSYDEHPPRARYPLEAFLFADRRGYCQQFSGAMTLLLRMDGIPARVAAGFRPGSYESATGRASVTALDAHSWVEVFFAGIGWYAFDPTPPRSAGPPAGSAIAPALRPVLAGRLRGSPGSGRRVAAPGAARRLTHRGEGSPWWPAAAVALVAAAVLAAGAWWLSAAVRLRRGLGGDGGGAVAELRAALARLEGAREGSEAPATTLAALEHRLQSRRGGRASAHLRALRELRYGGAVGLARPSPSGRRELRRALAEGGGLRSRVRALLALPPGAARKV